MSSGTWSLVGVESPRPGLTDAARIMNLTNEAGIGGTTRLLKNVMGLWIVQECRRAWNADFAALYADAAALPTGGPVFDPDDARFLAPGTDMPGRVQAACRETGQPVPQSPPEIVRCVLDSLARRIADVLDGLEAVTGMPVDTLYVVGGGSQGDLLNRLTADATGRPVIAGPVEATLIGNLLVQAQAGGHLRGVRLRDVVRASSGLQTFTPSSGQARAPRSGTRQTGRGVTP